MTYEDTDMYKLKKFVNAWFRTPPLTGPEENALVCEPTVRMMGTVDFSSTVGFSIVAFPSEPVNGKHLRCGWVLLPQAQTPRTVGVAIFNNV